MWPLPSHLLALRLHREMTGMRLPQESLARLEVADAEAARVGSERALDADSTKLPLHGPDQTEVDPVELWVLALADAWPCLERFQRKRTNSWRLRTSASALISSRK